MKNKALIIIVAVFVATLAVAAIVYPKLTDKYNESLTATTTELTVTEEAETRTPAATFTVYDADGNAVSLEKFRGKPTVVNFWATWCHFCVEELPDFETLYKQYGDKVNFVMVDLADGFSETQAKALTFIEENGYTFPVYFDNEFSATEAYSVQGIPMTLFIDANGGLYQLHNGLITQQQLTQYINILTGEAQ